jgi:hypothetical protein
MVFVGFLMIVAGWLLKRAHQAYIDRRDLAARLDRATSALWRHARIAAVVVIVLWGAYLFFER